MLFQVQSRLVANIGESLRDDGEEDREEEREVSASLDTERVFEDGSGEERRDV